MEAILKSLIINALFSVISAIYLVLFRKKIAIFFNVASGRAFIILGISLAFFSVMIINEIKNQRPPFVLLIITLDLIWVAASIIILIWRPIKISKNGYYSIATVAFLVLLMAVNQSFALSKLDNDEDGLKTLKFSRTVKAGKEKVWEVIADVGNFQKVSTNLTDVKIISGKGQGLVRSCSHGKETWTETCSLWIPQNEYTFIVNTDAPNYPHPLKYMSGDFKVESIDDSNSTIIMTFKFAYKKGVQNLLFHPFMKPQFSKNCEKILDNYQALITK